MLNDITLSGSRGAGYAPAPPVDEQQCQNSKKRKHAPARRMLSRAWPQIIRGWSFGYLVGYFGDYNTPFIPMVALLSVGALLWLPGGPTRELFTDEPLDDSQRSQQYPEPEPVVVFPARNDCLGTRRPSPGGRALHLTA